MVLDRPPNPADPDGFVDQGLSEHRANMRKRPTEDSNTHLHPSLFL